MQPCSWTVTIDTSYPADVTVVEDEAMHRFLDSIGPYRGALNVARPGRRGLAVTVSVDATELDESTFRQAAARGEVIVRERLPMLGLGDDWAVHSIEVSADDEHETLHLLPLTAIVW